MHRVDDVFAAEQADEGRARRIVVDLEHHRKDAKRLLRACRAGEASAVARAQAALGPRASARFLLTDAQYVIAVEKGYRSWPELRAAAPGRRTEQSIDTGLRYRPGDPVVVGVVRRAQRTVVTDHGGAIARTGRPRGTGAVTESLARELDVNISRHGVVSLPVVAVGPGEEAIVRRIAAASQRFYDELLELATEDTSASSGLHSTDDDRRSRRTDRRALP